MKISCDACQAKYSISDDKVQGKVFKIRCKKCSHIIVVRGVAATAPEPAPVDDTPDAVWHLVIDQEQVGPLTADEVLQRFTAGEINSETFGWREGFGDWLPIAEIDAFAAIAGAAGAADASDAVSSMFGTSAAVASEDLFAEAAPSGGGATEMHAAQKLRGERNESSVLFSLNNLAQIAESSPRRTPASTPASATPNAGAATGEGSGLIDIRSMASAYLGSAPGGAAAKAGKSNAPTIGSMDDLPVFGGGGFAEPAVIMPMSRPVTDRKVVNLMIAAVALLAILATVMIVMMVGGDKPTKVAAVTPAESPKPAVVVDEPAQREVAPVAAAGGGPPTPVAAAPEVAKPDKRIDKKVPATAAPARPAPGGHPGAAPPARPAAVPLPATAATGTCDEVECVLNGGACCVRFRKPDPSRKPEPTRTNLPDSLDRGMISTGVDAVKGRVLACGNKSPAKGKVLVKVSVASNGSVKGVAVETTPDAALGACVVANLQKASFAATKSGGSFRVPFTF